MLLNITDNTTSVSFAENVTRDDIINNVTNNVTDDAVQISDSVKFIGHVTVPMFFIVGLLGNALTLAVMTSKHFRTSTTSVYLSALAVSDSMYLVVSPFSKQFVNKLLKTDIRALSSAGCKTYFFFYRTTKIFSSWCVVTICIERFIVIWFPLHARRLSTRRSAVCALTGLALAIATFGGVWATLLDDVVSGVCIPNLVTSDTKQLSAAIIVAGIVGSVLIPMITLLVFTPLAILRLLRHRDLRRTMTHHHVTSTNHAPSRDGDTTHVTRTMLAVMSAYIILLSPISVAHLVAFFGGDNIFQSTDPGFVLFRELAQMFEGMNYSINFFLYVVSNETFREKLFERLACGSRSGSGSESGSGSGSGSPRQHAVVVASPTVASMSSVTSTLSFAAPTESIISHSHREQYAIYDQSER